MKIDIKNATEGEKNLLEGYFQVIRSKYDLQDSLEQRKTILSSLENMVSSLMRREREDISPSSIPDSHIAQKIKEEKLEQEILSKEYDWKTTSKLLKISGVTHRYLGERLGFSGALIDKYSCGQLNPKPHNAFGLTFLVYLRDTFGYNPYDLEISQTELQKMKDKGQLLIRKKRRA